MFTVQYIWFDSYLCYYSNYISGFDDFNSGKPKLPSHERKRRKSSFIFKIFPRTIWHSGSRIVYNARLVG